MTSLVPCPPSDFTPSRTRNSSSASNATSTSSLACPPSPPDEQPASVPSSWGFKPSLGEVAFTLQHPVPTDSLPDVADGGDEAAEYFALAIPSAFPSAGTDWGAPPSSSSSHKKSASGTPLGQPGARHRSSSIRSAGLGPSPNSSPPVPSYTSSTSLPWQAPAGPVMSAEEQLAAATALAEAERLPHLHLLPRPSLTPAQRKYSSSMKTATRQLLSLSLNAGSPSAESPSSTFGSDEGHSSVMQSPEDFDPLQAAHAVMPPLVGADDGDFALSASASPDREPFSATSLRTTPSLTTKTSYAELRAQAEERANALLALRRDSDGSPLDEEACVLEESESESDNDDFDASSSDDRSDAGSDVAAAGHQGRRTRSVRRRSGWRTNTRPGQHAALSPAPPTAFDESEGEEEGEEGATHFEFGSGRPH